MVETEEVQHPVDHEMRRVIGERDPGRLGLAGAGLVAEREVAEEERAFARQAGRVRQLAFEGWPAQHVGRLRLVAELGVERRDAGVVAGEQADLVVVGVPSGGRERRARRALGEIGDPDRLPARVIHQRLDQRWRRLRHRVGARSRRPG